MNHISALNWFDSIGPDSCAFCRLTQLGFLRLATNPAAFDAEAVTLAQAWQFYDTFSDDERVITAVEPGGIDDIWRSYTCSQQYSPKIWNDAFLTAFATSGGFELVTFDNGFKEFKGLQLRHLR